MSIDRGNTGLHHCQGILGGGRYFVAWAEARCAGSVSANDTKQTYDQPYTVSVIMAPKK